MKLVKSPKIARAENSVADIKGITFLQMDSSQPGKSPALMSALSWTEVEGLYKKAFVYNRF